MNDFPCASQNGTIDCSSGTTEKSTNSWTWSSIAHSLSPTATVLQQVTNRARREAKPQRDVRHHVRVCLPLLLGTRLSLLLNTHLSLLLAAHPRALAQTVLLRVAAVPTARFGRRVLMTEHESTLRWRGHQHRLVLARRHVVVSRQTHVTLDLAHQRGQLRLTHTSRLYQRRLHVQWFLAEHDAVHQLPEEETAQLHATLLEQPLQSLQPPLVQEFLHHTTVYASRARVTTTAVQQVRDQLGGVDAALPRPALLDLNERVESVGDAEHALVLRVAVEQRGAGADRRRHDLRAGTRETVDDTDKAIAARHLRLVVTTHYGTHGGVSESATARLHTLQTVRVEAVRR